MLHLDYSQFLCFAALLVAGFSFLRKYLRAELPNAPLMAAVFFLLAAKEGLQFIVLSLPYSPVWIGQAAYAMAGLAGGLMLLHRIPAVASFREGSPPLYLQFMVLLVVTLVLPKTDWAGSLLVAPLGIALCIISCRRQESSLPKEPWITLAWIAFTAWFALQLPLAVFQMVFQPAWTGMLPEWVTGLHLAAAILLWAGALSLWHAAHAASFADVRKTGYRIRSEDWSGFLSIPPVLLILFAGWLGAHTAGVWSGDLLRHDLLERAKTGAAALNPDAVGKLSQTEDPGSVPEYAEVVSMLTRIKYMSPDTRYVYLMGLRNAKVIFLAEAHYPDAAEPGELYDEASPELVASFENGEAFVEGPLQDRWGDWVSALVPLQDPNGHVVAVFGMDMAASDWYAHRQGARLVVIVVTGLILAVVVSLLVGWQTRRHQNLLWAMSEARFRLLDRVISQSSNGVIITDMLEPGQPIMFVNAAFTRITGYTSGEALGRNCRFLQGTDRDQPDLQKLKTSINNRAECRVILRNYRKDGTMFWNELSIFPVFDPKGKLTHYVGLQTDATERRQAEAELLRAKEEAEAANFAKSEFLANMSHEIRTPLNGIIGSIELMERSHLNEEHRNLLDTVATSSGALLSLINDILDFSKIESGKTEMKREPVHLRLLLEECLQMFAINAERKQLLLAGTVDAEVPDTILADALKLRQILINLIGNAIKFTEKGEVEVRMTLKKTEASLVELECTVRDTGIGIPREKQAALFNPFIQGDSSISKKYGGTGLGLAISSRLAVQMGGSLRLESQPGEGTVFFLRFRTELAPASTDPAGVDPGRLTLHVIEPRFLYRKELICLAEAWGWEWFSAADTSEIVARIQKGRKPDVIVLAGDLPDGQSTDHLEELKGSPETSGIPVLLTLPMLEKDGGETGSLATQAAAVVSRPLRSSQVMDEVVKALHPGALKKDRASKAASQGPGLDPGLKILLVEDNPVNQLVARGLLKRLGCKAGDATNGKEALHQLDSTDYDVVLMDVQMPVMDGITATHEIRARYPKSRQPFIVALTANALEGDRERFLAEGMDEYLSKPVTLERLKEVLQKATVLRRTH
jgi:PAS domain S-box-containing protein